MCPETSQTSDPTIEVERLTNERPRSSRQQTSYANPAPGLITALIFLPNI
jgi:hypothetical protein